MTIIKSIYGLMIIFIIALLAIIFFRYKTNLALQSLHRIECLYTYKDILSSHIEKIEFLNKAILTVRTTNLALSFTGPLAIFSKKMSKKVILKGLYLLQDAEIISFSKKVLNLKSQSCKALSFRIISPYIKKKRDITKQLLVRKKKWKTIYRIHPRLYFKINYQILSNFSVITKSKAGPKEILYLN